MCYSNSVVVTSRYPHYLRKQRQELLQDWKKQPTRIFLREDLAVQSIMDCRTTPSMDFKSRQGFKNQDPIMTQEQSILTKISKPFSTEEIIFQHFVLGYRIDAYFLKYKLAIEVDEKGHQDRDLECKTERQKALERELDCNIISINPVK